jgi:hypothetical protein
VRVKVSEIGKLFINHLSESTSSKSAYTGSSSEEKPSSLSTRSKSVLIATVASSGVLIATTGMLYVSFLPLPLPLPPSPFLFEYNKAYNFMKRRVHHQEFAVAWKAVATSDPDDEDGPMEAWSETDTLNSDSSPREV